MRDIHSTDRRRILQLAASAAGSLWLPRSAWSQPKLAADPFTLGVASGSPAETSVVLWTRLAQPDGDALGGAPATVRWEIAEDEGFQRIAHKGQSQAHAELAHSVHVEAQGLAPDRWYFYRFMTGEWVSRTGRTRTLPPADAQVAKLRFGYGSCQRWEHGYFSAWRHLREEQPDFVLFFGDYIYEYPGAPNSIRMPRGLWATTLSDYRERHAQYKSDADLQAMHAACPWLVTWDDHELQNDYAGEHPGNSGPGVANHMGRRAAAYQAYYEHMPLRAATLTRAMSGLGDGAELRIHTQYRFGKLARLCLLDTRQYRDRQACTRGGRAGSGSVDPAECESWDDPRRTLLGEAQERWLDARLAQNAPGWTLIGQSTLFGRRDFKAGAGELFSNDGWDGYAQARQRLTRSLQQHAVKNTVMLGGDVHQNWVGHLKADYAREDSEALGTEFCGTSITSRTTSTPERVPGVLAENPHFIFADAYSRGYGVADFTPGRLDVRLRAVDDVTRRDSGVKTLASFAVQAGRHRVEKA